MTTTTDSTMPDPSASTPTRGSMTIAPTSDDAASQSRHTADAGQPPRSRMRLVITTILWWLHGAVRALLAAALLVYGASKLGLGQFGMADMGDSLIAFGEMSPMGLLWRMVAYSPLFQVLAGLAEVGAALALLWRRTALIGALLAIADMAFVVVLNLGYDVPVKQLSTALLVMGAIVLLPWIPRLVRSLLSHGEVGRGPVPTLVPWRPLARITDVLGPITAVALIAAGSWMITGQFHMPTPNNATPAGVWSVSSDTAKPAAQLSEDERWQKVAFGNQDGSFGSRVQVRLANGELKEGRYERTSPTTITVELHEQRAEGQTVQDWLDSPAQELTLTIDEQTDGTLHVTGDGVDLVLAPDESGRLLHDRGFSWSPRPDDPFNR